MPAYESADTSSVFELVDVWLALWHPLSWWISHLEPYCTVTLQHY